MDRTRTRHRNFLKNSLILYRISNGIPGHVLCRDLEFLLLGIDKEDPPVSHVGMKEKFFYPIH